jgi:hypothetical protein
MTTQHKQESIQKKKKRKQEWINLIEQGEIGISYLRIKV